ncbi:hemoglobin [Neisseria sp. HSC-16F19]|nr:group II truncated hemoglobin [Neisseria sp. HSC-16F19]MCP2040878.1 hemoglobin [Neisseria sp. HSC-16F19]
MNAYQALGGEAGTAALTARFYDLMDSDARFAALRATHGASLDYARERLFQFLSGWLGGPPLYEELHGHPRLRQRHMPFVVTVKTRNQWIACFAQALQDTAAPPEWAVAVVLRLFALADWMRNQEEAKYPPPQPPMAADIAERVPELQAVLAEYGLADFLVLAE